MIDPDDFLHFGLGLSDHSSVVVGEHDVGHFQTDPFGHIQHIGPDNLSHGETWQDALGAFHHDEHGVATSSSFVDPLGNMHHLDQAHHEIGQVHFDPLGHAHVMDQHLHEGATTHTDALGHVQVVPAPGVEAAGTDPFNVLDQLLKQR
jgi:hypothetical protein